jgi:NADPH-dependent ferric siderophore reductase
MSLTSVHTSSRELADRLSVEAILAEVSRVQTVTPTLVAVTLTHPDAVRVAGTPGNDVMVRLQEPDGRFVRRRYSVRSVSETDRSFTLWISTTHDGAGATWASNATPGDVIDLVGPRGKIPVDALADWHLFVGDATAIGAFYRMAESVDPPGQVIFAIEIADLTDAVTTSLPEGLGVTAAFIDRDGRAPNDPTGLLRGLATIELPPGVGQAYVFGELSVSRAMRVALLDRGLRDEQVSLKAFWRAGVHNAEHGEPPKE